MKKLIMCLLTAIMLAVPFVSACNNQIEHSSNNDVVIANISVVLRDDEENWLYIGTSLKTNNYTTEGKPVLDLGKSYCLHFSQHPGNCSPLQSDKFYFDYDEQYLEIADATMGEDYPVFSVRGLQPCTDLRIDIYYFSIDTIYPEHHCYITVSFE